MTLQMLRQGIEFLCQFSVGGKQVFVTVRLAGLFYFGLKRMRNHSLLKFFLLFIASCLSNCGFAHSQVDSLNISGPEQAKPGQLIRLVAEIDPVETPFWIVLQPTNLDYEQVDNGRRLIFAVGCETQDSSQGNQVVVMLLAQQVKDGKIVTRQLRRRITIESRAPDPINPVVDPDAPDTTQPLDGALFRTTLKALESVSDPVAYGKRSQVAENFLLVANRCKSGDFDDLPAIWLTLSQLNGATLRGHTNQWSKFATKLQLEFKRLKLTTPASHAKPLQTVGEALKKGIQR